jgi:hypothetical protein
MAAPPSRSSPPSAPTPIAFVPVEANPLLVVPAAPALTPATLAGIAEFELVPALALTPRTRVPPCCPESSWCRASTWILVLDERCEVVPVAVSVWFPLLSLELKAILVHQVPLVLALTEGYRVRSRVMVTLSPARKPAPQNVMVDPAVGCEVLTEVVA